MATKKATKKSAKDTKVVLGKADIVNDVYANAREGDLTSKAQADRIISAAFESLGKHLHNGERVSIFKLGSFVCVTRSARTYRTPQGGTVEKGETKRIKFKPSSFITTDMK